MPNNYIQTDQLRTTTQRLIDETMEINNLFQGKVIPTLNACQEDLKVSGLNYDEVQTTFNNVFNSIVNQLNELSDAMENKIIPKYEQAAASISKLFNQDFANQMNTIMNNINKQ